MEGRRGARMLRGRFGPSGRARRHAGVPREPDQPDVGLGDGLAHARDRHRAQPVRRGHGRAVRQGRRGRRGARHAGAGARLPVARHEAQKRRHRKRPRQGPPRNRARGGHVRRPCAPLQQPDGVRACGDRPQPSRHEDEGPAGGEEPELRDTRHFGPGQDLQPGLPRHDARMRHGASRHPLRQAREARQGGRAPAPRGEDRGADGVRRVRHRHEGRHAARLRANARIGRVRSSRVQYDFASRRAKLQPVREPVRENAPRGQVRPRADIGRRQGGLARSGDPQGAFRGLRARSRPLPTENDAGAFRQGLHRSNRFEARNGDDLDRGRRHERRGIARGHRGPPERRGGRGRGGASRQARQEAHGGRDGRVRRRHAGRALPANHGLGGRARSQLRARERRGPRVPGAFARPRPGGLLGHGRQSRRKAPRRRRVHRRMGDRGDRAGAG